MKHNNTKSTKSTKDSHSNPLISNLINWGFVVLFLIIIVVIYYYFFYPRSMIYEKFDMPITTQSNKILKSPKQQTPEIPETPETPETPININKMSIKPTIYEKSLNNLYGNNIRMMCNILPTLDNSVCVIGSTPFVKYTFPIHMIKLQNGQILAVFNDGRIYSKDNILATIWNGPHDNSLPNNSVPLRMITLTNDLSNLLGVGYDNKLYISSLDINGGLDTDAIWKPVPNNTNIIYVIYDRDTHCLVSIDTSGKLFIKKTQDITDNNTEITNILIDRPLLRLYYDVYGYMLAIDTNFNLYQFKEKDWKTCGLNLERGHNLSKINDILYNNDGKLIGLVFVENANMLHVMKQSEIFYLSQFIPLDIQETLQETTKNNNFMLSDADIINNKIGYINPVILNADDDTIDQDVSFAFHKQTLENQKKLRDFCNSRSATVGETNVENYDLLSNVEQNTEKINLLQAVLNNLIKYDPERKKIQEQYPILFTQDY